MKACGLMATFVEKNEFIEALIALRQQGFRHIETLSSQEIEGIENILGQSERSPFYSFVALGGALLGIFGGFSMQWYANVVDMPLNIGGRPLNSWPSFIPVTFVLMILCSALSLTLGFFIKLRLPWPSHPIFKSSLDLSQGTFAILLYSKDPLYETTHSTALLKQLKALRVEEIPWE